MKLSVLLPEKVLVDEDVTKVIAEAQNGSFCLLPRHVDMVAALVPGILSFETESEEKEAFVAVDEGILVKCGDDVLVSVRHAVRGPDLGSLEQTVREQFRVVDEQERVMRSALVKLEVDVMRRFMELREL